MVLVPERLSPALSRSLEMIMYKRGLCVSIFVLTSGCLPNLPQPLKPQKSVQEIISTEEKTASDRVNETIVRLSNEAMVQENVPSNFSSNLTFFDAVRHSVENNPKVELARQKILSAGFGREIAESARKVQFKTSGGLGHSAKSEQSKYVKTTGPAVTIQASLLLFDGGEVDSKIDVSEVNYLIAETDLNIAKSRVAYEAANAWLEMWAATRAQAVLSKNETEISTIKKQLDTLQTTGILDVGELADINAKMKDLELTKRQVSHKETLAKLDFKLHFGPNAKAKKLPDIDVFLNTVSDRGFTELEIPALKRLILDHAVAEFRVNEAKAALKPKVSSLASLSSPQSVNGASEARIGLFFDYIIGDGGNRAARIAAAEADFSRVGAEINYQFERAKVAFDGAKANLKSNLAILDTSRNKLQILKTQLKTASSQRTLGQGAIQKVFELKIEISDAELKLIQLQSETHKSVLELHLSTGRLLQFFAV